MSATNRGSVRNERDFYSTPEYTIKSILDEIDMDKVNSFCEPCYGTGAIWDLINSPQKHWFEIEMGRDYLNGGVKPKVQLTLTNPPFSLAKDFIDMAMSHSKTVIMLLRLNFLGAQCRKEWWQSRIPDQIYVLSTRPKFSVNKHGKLGSDASEYGWFLWGNMGIMKRKGNLFVI